MRRFAVSLFSLFIISTSSIAAEISDLGPDIGAPMPHDLSALDSENMQQSFDTLKGEKGAVLLFFRSAKWCPYCQKQLINLNKITADVKAHGYEIIGISYDKVKHLKKFKKRRSISFPLLSDPESEIIKAWDIMNPDYKRGHYAHGVPYPLIAFVSPDGTIQAKLYEQSYKDRPENELILERLAKLTAE